MPKYKPEIAENLRHAIFDCNIRRLTLAGNAAVSNRKSRRRDEYPSYFKIQGPVKTERTKLDLLDWPSPREQTILQSTGRG